MSASWIDVTMPLRHGMVHWPGDPAASVVREKDMARGDPVTLTSLAMGAHTGTHMDAPVHYVVGGKAIDEVPLDVLIGEARVVEAHGARVEAADVEAAEVRAGERILWKTQNSARPPSDEFRRDFVYISEEAARGLVGAALVGVDYLSVAGMGDDGPRVHQILLGAGVWLVEGLDLSRVAPGRYHLICLPLRLVGADGAPARAILRPITP